MKWNRLKPVLLATLLAFSLAAQAADDRPPAPPDLHQIEQLQHRIDRLASVATGENSYTLAKARALLDEALIAYHNHSGSVEDAIARAVSLLSVFDANPDLIGLDTRNPYASEKISADLWAIGYAMKQGGGIPCAELDAQLVWSDREKLESGWGNAEPYARIAESLAYAAQAADRCASAAKAPAPATTVAEEPVPVVLAAPSAIEQISNTLAKASLAADVLFTFGSYRMVRDGRQGLDKIVAELKSWSSLERIQITGHTDRLGKKANNQKLAQRRAEHVKTYLVSRGIPAAAIETQGLGAAQPLVECTTQRNRRALINCLQPNRRVEMTIQGAWR